MITEEQNRLSISVVESLKGQQQNWLPKQEIRNTVQPESLNDFEFVLKDLQYFHIIEFLANGQNIRLTENARKFKGLKKEFYKKEITAKTRFLITTGVAIVSLIVSVWLTNENSKLKKSVDEQESQIMNLNNKVEHFQNELNQRSKENIILKTQIDSVLSNCQK